MKVLIRHCRQQGPKFSLPGFANATGVIRDAIGPNEYRVRKAEVIPTDDLHFTEEDMPIARSEPRRETVTGSLRVAAAAKRCRDARAASKNITGMFR